MARRDAPIGVAPVARPRRLTEETTTESPTTTELSGPREILWERLRTGDCLAEFPATDTFENVLVTTCESAHIGEVCSTARLADSEPGQLPSLSTFVVCILVDVGGADLSGSAAA